MDEKYIPFLGKINTKYVRLISDHPDDDRIIRVETKDLQINLRIGAKVKPINFST